LLSILALDRQYQKTSDLEGLVDYRKIQNENSADIGTTGIQQLSH
jgi:hypothetical protein